MPAGGRLYASPQVKKVLVLKQECTNASPIVVAVLVGSGSWLRNCRKACRWAMMCESGLDVEILAGAGHPLRILFSILFLLYRLGQRFPAAAIH